MDLVAEYAYHYGGPPEASHPWHEVVALVNRRGQFDARAVLHVVEGQGLMEGLKLGETTSAMLLGKLEREAR